MITEDIAAQHRRGQCLVDRGIAGQEIADDVGSRAPTHRRPCTAMVSVVTDQPFTRAVDEGEHVLRGHRQHIV